MTTMDELIKKAKKEFMSGLRLNNIDPRVDPEDGGFEDHLSFSLWQCIEAQMKKAYERGKEDKLKEINERLTQFYNQAEDGTAVSNIVNS